MQLILGTLQTRGGSRLSYQLLYFPGVKCSWAQGSCPIEAPESCCLIRWVEEDGNSWGKGTDTPGGSHVSRETWTCLVGYD